MSECMFSSLWFPTHGGHRQGCWVDGGVTFVRKVFMARYAAPAVPLEVDLDICVRLLASMAAVRAGCMEPTQTLGLVWC